jgi:hypothetical protein
MSTLTPELARLGDELQVAASADLAARRRVRTRRGAALLAVGAVLVSAGAVAATLFTPAQVAAGLPAGAVIFGGTQPTCALDSEGETYRCTLAAPPRPDDGVGVAPPAKAPTAAGSPDYTDVKEPLVIDGVVAGGCIGTSPDGRAWDCYIGTDAVDHGILSDDFLGEPAGPGRG